VLKLLQTDGPRKRELRCRTCGAVLTMTRELASTWVFRCQTCQAAVFVAKSEAGGTEGAGESETRIQVRGADIEEG
jgi:hypothetical protein